MKLQTMPPPFSTGDSNQIKLNMAQIQSFINNSTIKTKEFFIEGNWNPQNYIEHFYNYGRIETANPASLNTQNTSTGGGYKNIYNYGYISGYVWLSSNESGVTNIINHGEMGGVSGNTDKQDKTIIIDNLGVVNLFQKDNQGNKIHFKELSTLILKNYAMKIDKGAVVFNTFDGQNANDNSHLVVEGVSSVEFANSDSRIILDFGGNFELGKGYLFDKLVVDTSGNNKLQVDLSRLIPRSDIYTLYKQGDYFIARLQPQHSAISNIYKSNIRIMNNFQTISNSMIYPRKSYHSQNLRSSSLRASEYERGNPFALSSLRDLPTANRGNLFIKESLDSALDSTLDSAIPLKSYESFAYRNESVNRRIQRQNKRNYNRKTTNAESSVKSQSGLPRATSRTRNDDSFIDSANKTNKTNQHNLQDSANQQSSSLRADSQNLRGNPQNQNTSQNLAQNPHDYYFILTPFVNYNSFAQSGNYNLSGFDYGFLTAFSAQVAESNHLGTHFIFSYGKLGDKQDKDLSIKTLNLNLGINYKLDLVWDMYIKARGDFFYFSNQVKTLTMFEAIKPNNIGFGVSVAYGKDFDFKSGGVLGLEVGLDYKVLKTNEVLLNSQNYKQSLLNLIYADLGLNYNKYFDSFGINLGTGFKANLAPRLAKSTLLINTHNLQFTIDNDKYLAYANAGISYVLNKRDFDMEFSLQYYGSFGDRGMSNGGGIEFRVNF